jgi:adenosine kinase
MIEYAKVYREKGVQYICDPGQSLTAWDAEAFTEWINGSSMLVSNDYELEMIMKMTGKDKRGLLSLTKTIITTLGEKGSLISTSEKEIPIPSARVHRVLDPTGAGDAFRAGLIKGIVTEKKIQTAAQMGAVSATYAIENYGTQEHRYSFEDFVKRYQENFGKLD